MAVLPTPGSPISTGLFLVRRDRICMTRSSSRVRPITGSSLRSRASWVKLRPNWSRIWLLAPLSPGRPPSTTPPTLAPTTRPPPPSVPAARALVARQQLDHLLADAAEVGAELDEHLGGDALALTDEAEQDVLGADVVVAELQRLAQRQLEHLLGSRGERDVARRRRAALADDLLDLAAHGLERDAETLERLRRDALTLVDQPEQDVLGADVRVIEQTRLFLGENDDPAGSVSEAFEHWRPFSGDDGTSVYRYPRGAGGRLRPGEGVVATARGSARSARIAWRGCPTRPHRRVRRPGVTSARRSWPWDRWTPTGRASRRRCSTRCSTPDPYLTELASHLVVAGGKRLRPVVSVVAAAVGAAPVSDDVVRGGVACELVHLGSLYHDDVIDDSDVRRGVETVNAKWGNLQAILAGDFLLSRASEIAASLGTEVAGLLARTIGWLCEGEIEQLRHTYDIDAHRGRATSRRSTDKTAVAVRHGGAHRRHRRRARPPRRRDARPLGQLVRDGVPDRRRHPRHHRERRAPRQAGRPRHGGGRLHPSRPAHAASSATGSARSCASLLGKPLDLAERDKALAIVRANEGVESAVATARRYVDAAEAACDDLPPGAATDALRAAPATLARDQRCPRPRVSSA